MHRHFVCVSLLLLAVLIGSGSARADAVQMNLGPSTDLVTFISMASLLSVQLGNCSPNCTLASPANSFLTINGVPSSNFGIYTITTNLNGGSLPVLTSLGSGVYNYAAGLSVTTFSINLPSNLSFAAGSLALTLTIQTVTGGNTPASTFHGLYTVNSTSGILAPFFPGGATNLFDFTVMTGAHVDDVVATHGQTSGTVTSGTIHTPEPASIALFGSGLLLLGHVLRRRKPSAPAKPSEE